MAHLNVQAGQVDGSPDYLPSAPCTMAIPIAIASWQPPLAHCLRNVLANPPYQAHLFPQLLAHAARYGEELAREASDVALRAGQKPELFQLATCLFSFRIAKGQPPIAWTLAWLLLEAHLSGRQTELISDLAQTIRGLSSGKSSLTHTIADCKGPAQLLAKMGRLKLQNPDLGITGHQNFDSLWRRELEAFCHSLVRRSSSDVTDEDDLDLINAPLSPTILLTDISAGASGEGQDESAWFTSPAIGVDQKIPDSKLRSALDWTTHMSRRSSPDLLRPSDNVLPKDLREWEWQAAIAQTEQALAERDLSAAEYGLVRILAIETGLSRRETNNVAFGTTTVGRIPVIDLSIQALRRPEALPQNQFSPAKHDSRWQPTGGEIIFPLSAQLARLGHLLQKYRDERKLGTAANLLVSAEARSHPKHPRKIRAATASTYRLSLAIHIADKLGIDAAQMAFGETFGLSTAAVFYGRHPALAVTNVLESVNNFQGCDQKSKPWEAAASHWLGSRVCPKQPPYANVWSILAGTPQRPRGRPSDASLLAEWEKRRNRLLIHFLLATGHRPNASVLKLSLHDFFPKHALAVVRDKQVDPAHSTRLVCTGWRFIGELESYVKELERISRKSDNRSARTLASSILSASSPLFALPEGTTEAGSSSIRELLSSLDPLWGERTNLHRHGLGQFLIQNRLDPEHRYFQMGWMPHAHHATSDSAPYPAFKLGHEIAPVIDRWLDECGWQGGCSPKEPTNLIPLQPLDSWVAKRANHGKTIADGYASMKAEILENTRQLEAEVWKKIQNETVRALSDYEAGTLDSRPIFAPLSSSHCPPIDDLQVEGLLTSFSENPYTHMHRHVAARLLRAALLRTAKVHGCRVHLPQVPVISRHQVYSPFLSGSGLAVSQMDALQEAMLQRLPCIQGSGVDTVTELASMTLLSLLMHTTCSSLDDAAATLKQADSAEHATSEPWQIRVPCRGGHMVLTGDQAVLTARLVKLEGWKHAIEEVTRNDGASLGAFISRIAPELQRQGASNREVAHHFIDTANIAKSIRCNGPERLIASSAATPATVSSIRAASAADNATIESTGAPQDLDTPAPQMEPPHSCRQEPAHRPVRKIADVMRAFHSDYSGTILGNPVGPPKAKRHQLRLLLENTLSKVGEVPTKARVLLEYTWHLLVNGGPLSKGGQAPSTILKTYYRIEPVFRAIPPEESLRRLSCDEVTALCCRSFQKSRRAQHQEIVDELRRFFDFAIARHQISEPNWDMLRRSFGQASTGGDPAVVADNEAQRVLEELHQEVVRMETSDADPAERRYSEVCLITGLIAEASGVRPRSIHGLTLDDFVLGQEQDYVLLRARGTYASIKTPTSAGFIPLQGELWLKHALWFRNWLAGVCTVHTTGDLSRVPLFQIPGEPLGMRYDLRKVSDRIGSLVRWSTGQQRGRTYWLRKRRVRQRHRRVMEDHKSLAKDMAHAMRLDGHALITTPLISYVGEPSAYLSNEQPLHAVSSSTGASAISGLSSRVISRFTRHAEQGSQDFVAKLLQLHPATWTEAPLHPAPEARRYAGDLSSKSVERILRSMAEGIDSDFLPTMHGASKLQVESIAGAVRTFCARTRCKIGNAKGSIAPPRAAGYAARLLQLLENEDSRLATVADDWVNVSGGRIMADGCRLLDPVAMTCFRELIRDTAGDVRCLEHEEDHGVRLFGIEKKVGGTSYGIWPALRWALLSAWIARNRMPL